MDSILDQVVTYARENPGVVASTCLAVLLISITQIVLASSRESQSGALSDSYSPFPLIEKTLVSHNTRIFRFALPSESSTLGLSLGRHISLRANIDGKEIRRPYTPITSEQCLGHFELLVKIYPEPYGLMSRHLDAIRIGDCIDVRGPLGRFSYSANAYRKLHMVCGGTGITPMWQVFRAVLSDPNDTTEVSLVFANVTEDDILLRDQLDDLAASEERFSVYYVLNDPPDDWDQGVGFVTKDILEKTFGPAESDCKVLMCGPPAMNKAMKTVLASLGYTDEQIFKF